MCRHLGHLEVVRKLGPHEGCVEKVGPLGDSAIMLVNWRFCNNVGPLEVLQKFGPLAGFTETWVTWRLYRDLVHLLTSIIHLRMVSV